MSKASERLAFLAKNTEKIISSINVNYLLKEIPDKIRIRTRLGKGVKKEQGELETLKPFKKTNGVSKYIEKRSKSKLSPYTKPNKSNLTFTGSMLESIKGSRVGNKLIFKVTGDDENGISNDKKAGWVSEDRPFFNLSKSEFNGFSRKVSATIREYLRNLFK